MAMIVMVSVIVTTIITMIISDDENGSDNDNEHMYSIVWYLELLASIEWWPGGKDKLWFNDDEEDDDGPRTTIMIGKMWPSTQRWWQWLWLKDSNSRFQRCYNINIKICRQATCMWHKEITTIMFPEVYHSDLVNLWTGEADSPWLRTSNPIPKDVEKIPGATGKLPGVKKWLPTKLPLESYEKIL